MWTLVLKKLILPKKELFLIYIVMRNFTFRKRLIAFAVSAFACLGANAYSFEGNALIVTPEDIRGGSSFINGIANEMPHQNVTTIKLVGTFTSWTDGWLGDNGSVESKKGITTIDLSGADLSAFTDTSWKFSNFTDLRTIQWPPVGKITVIPSFAFKLTGIQQVSIPGYIERIMGHAFDSDSGDGYLKSVVFEEYDPDKDGESDVNMTIEARAFSNTYGVFDVYIETLGDLQAENMAFPEAITYGQGNTSNPLARLHFPDSKAEDYVNQNHILDQETANDDGKFQAWLVAHYTAAGTEGNGWYEFVSNGSSKKVDSDQGEAVLFTFSHASIDYIVPKGAKAFIVGSVKNQGGDYLMELVKVNVIPHGTGVIIYGGTNSKTKEGYRTLEMTAVKYEGTPYNRTPQEVNGVNVYNLLVPTATADGSSTYIKPYDLSSDGKKIEYRNFVMSKFSQSESGRAYYKKHSNYGTGEGLPEGNYVGFFRTLKGYIASGKAYLKCLATEDEVAESTCGEIQVKEHPTYRVEYADVSPFGSLSEDEMKAKGYWWYKDGSNDVKILWKDSWGTRKLAAGTSSAKFSGEPFLDVEDEDGVVTLIVPGSMIDGEESGDYYNLQGVKVSHPTKGIYVKNGKKVVIK